MNYLLDKKTKRNKNLKLIFFALILFILIYFRSPIFSGLSYVSNFIFKPILILGNNIGEKLSNTTSFFYSKESLFLENKYLQSKLNEQKARIVNYNSILDENLRIKEILNRKNEKSNLILASILSKPNKSPYDTIIIDVGSKQNIEIDDLVFAFGNIPLGRVADVYPNSSKVILFSNSREKTEVVISGKQIFMEVIGRGGGNFEMILPRDFILEKGAEVVLPGIRPYVLAIVQTIISDPRDSFQKALLASPVNIQELKFVEIQK